MKIEAEYPERRPVERLVANLELIKEKRQKDKQISQTAVGLEVTHQVQQEVD